MLNKNDRDGFEAKVLIYAHRVLLVFFLGTLIVVGAIEAYRRVREAVPFDGGASPTLDRRPAMGVSSLQKN